MELRHLRYFAAAAELGHFGRAAERLNIVQPALSKQIRELEEELGVALFERLPRGVRLTPAGHAFAEEVVALLARVPAAAERARQVASGRVGRLRIGFVDTAIYPPPVPRMIDRFRRAFPEVRVELVQQTSLRQGEMLGRGELDLSFAYHAPEGLAGLEKRLVLSERVVLAAPSSHRVAGLKSVRLSDLKDESFVWIPRDLSPPYHDLVFAACRKAGFAPKVVQEGRSDGALLGLVAGGAGLSFSLSSTRHRCPRAVVLIPIADRMPVIRLQALWLRYNDNPALPGFLAAAGLAAKR